MFILECRYVDKKLCPLTKSISGVYATNTHTHAETVVLSAVRLRIVSPSWTVSKSSNCALTRITE